jgi:hypothetical protein
MIINSVVDALHAVVPSAALDAFFDLEEPTRWNPSRSNQTNPDSKARTSAAGITI